MGIKRHCTLLILLAAVAALGLSSCRKGHGLFDYDVFQINGESYACYGYRCFMTLCSDWNLSEHSGSISLPYGKLSDAKKGEYDIFQTIKIYLSGDRDLSKGCKLEDFEPELRDQGLFYGYYDYRSGSATVINKKDDDYITIKFESFSFKGEDGSLTLDGTVQLSLDEDEDED